MDSRVVFTYELNDELKEKWIDFLKIQEYFPRLQHPNWVILKNLPGKPCYFMLYKQNKLSSVCIIIENKMAANINFGPICLGNEIYLNSLAHILKRYKQKRSFGLLRLTMPQVSSVESEQLEYHIYKIAPFKQKIDRENWTSICIDLTRSQEELLSNYNRNQKRAVKKAEKANFLIEPIKEKEQVNELSTIFDEMWRSRKLPNIYQTKERLNRIFEFFKSEELGTMLGVFDEDKNMIGGALLFFEGNTMSYEAGASSPKYRNMPILHSLFHETIRFGKEKGFKTLDLGGYNLFVSENDQVHSINRFKEGLGGKITTYPKKMYFVLNPIIYAPFKLALWLRNHFTKK